MADTKVSALTNVDPLAAADEFYVVDATGTTSAAVLASVVATFVLSQTASSVDITGGSISGITDLAVADGGTGASTAADARTNLDVYSTGEVDSEIDTDVATHAALTATHGRFGLQRRHHRHRHPVRRHSRRNVRGCVSDHDGERSD